MNPRKEINKVKFLNALIENGIRWQKLSEIHYRIGEFDFLPTVNKYMNRDTNKVGIGVQNLIAELKK